MPLNPKPLPSPLPVVLFSRSAYMYGTVVIQQRPAKQSLTRRVLIDGNGNAVVDGGGKLILARG